MQTYGDIELTMRDPDQWTLSHVLSAKAAECGDKVFIRHLPGQEITFAQAEDLARRVAQGFVDDGIVAGDRVAILSENCIEFIVGWFATACAGVVEVPISPYYRGSGLARLMSTVAPAAVLCQPDLVREFIDSGSAEHVSRVYLLPGQDAELARKLLAAESPCTVRDFVDLYQCERLDGHVRRPHELASVLFTSGTTGLPKGVAMPEAQLYFFSEQFRSYEQVVATDVYLHDKPMYTALSHFHAVYASLIAGCTLALYDRFSAGLWATRVHDSKATVVVLLGEMMDFLMKQPPSALDHDNQLRCISCGPTSWAVAADFLARFGGDVIAEAYGQTEISIPIMTPYGAERPPGACGLLVDQWFELRLADPDTDKESAAGELGELQVRHRVPWTMCDGYYGDADATAASRRNLWFHTGDLFRRDDAGWYYFVDRARDVIRRRGVNISSKEIEDAFLGCGLVRECAVVSVAPASTGESEEVLAVVASSEEISNIELVRWVETRLPYYAVPRYISRTDALPLTPSGKVRKAELRAQGVTATTWDRHAAGVVLEREAITAEQRRLRSV